MDILSLLSAHPLESVVGGLILGTVCIKKLQLPVWDWLVAWLKAGVAAFGRCLTAPLMAEVAGLRGDVTGLRDKLDAHITDADKREADGWRASILHFNVELIQHTPHTREDFIEILTDIDSYETYCETHPNYENNRAVLAVANIKRVYAERLQKGFKEDT